MILIVNGQEHTVEPGVTVRQLIERLHLEKSACAVEVNKRLVPRREHETWALSACDVVELVALVGGG